MSHRENHITSFRKKDQRPVQVDLTEGTSVVKTPPTGSGPPTKCTKSGKRKADPPPVKGQRSLWEFAKKAPPPPPEFDFTVVERARPVSEGLSSASVAEQLPKPVPSPAQEPLAPQPRPRPRPKPRPQQPQPPPTPPPRPLQKHPQPSPTPSPRPQHQQQQPSTPSPRPQQQQPVVQVETKMDR